MTRGKVSHVKCCYKRHVFHIWYGRFTFEISTTHVKFSFDMRNWNIFAYEIPFRFWNDMGSFCQEKPKLSGSSRIMKTAQTAYLNFFYLTHGRNDINQNFTRETYPNETCFLRTKQLIVTCNDILIVQKFTLEIMPYFKCILLYTLRII